MRMDNCVKKQFLLMFMLAFSTGFLGGCGDNSAMTAAPMPPRKPLPVITVSTEPRKMKFNQMVFESAITKTRDENNLMFYVFNYSDNDGKGYRCRLPVAMAQGEYVASDWISTFNVYREVPINTAKKVARRANSANIHDFPFVVRKAAASFSGSSR